MKAKYEELDLETLNSDFFDLLENSDLQIYWPYSDNWNGLDKPIIVCGSEDEKSVYIFKGDNNELPDEVLVEREDIGYEIIGH